jgi:hypothetical protein
MIKDHRHGMPVATRVSPGLAALPSRAANAPPPRAKGAMLEARRRAVFAQLALTACIAVPEQCSRARERR